MANESRTISNRKDGRFHRAGLWLAALAYAALAAHLLFIPYEYAPLALTEAVRLFRQMPWLELGSDQNVALVSRSLMWIPVGTLLAVAIAPRPRSVEFGVLIAAASLGILWAVIVSFAQYWFPARTHSLNNLAAETIGVIIGASFWSLLGAPVQRWWRRLKSGGLISGHAALGGYVVLYLLASLTPLDFVTGANELQEKLASDHYGLWRAPIGCGAATSCGPKFLAVLIATVPCGWWFCAQRPGQRHVWLPAVVLAAGVSILIEALHFLMVSGVSQGVSVAVRVAGVALGVATYGGRHFLAPDYLNRFGRPAVAVLFVPYLTAVAYVAGWFHGQRLDMARGLARVDSIVWLPFVHQYFAEYQATMFSAMVHFSLYAPVGAMCWLWVRNRERAPLGAAALIAALIAIIFEMSKVFLAEKQPDFADVVIAAASAMLSLTILRFVLPGRRVAPFPAARIGNGAPLARPAPVRAVHSGGASRSSRPL
jgi:VanZ family protein